VVRQRVRIRFSKAGDLRLISHRDLMRALERLLRRAGLPLGMSEGFHPKPRLSFPNALAVGVVGLNEVMELELSEVYTAQSLLDLLQRHAPEGLTFLGVEILPEGAKKARVRQLRYEVPVPAERQAAVRERIAGLWAETQYLVQREQRQTPVDIRAGLEALSLADDKLQFGLSVAEDGTARPREVLAALGLEDLEQLGLYLTRTAVEVAP
jgi:radical SAM-linked protein